MPARIDRVGRAHEHMVRHLLKPTTETKRDFNSVLAALKAKYPDTYDEHLKRIKVGGKHTADHIKNRILKGRQIVRVDHVGEAQKGISDADIIVHTDDDAFGVSLKLYKTKNFNLWNPTIETLTLHLTGKRFSEYLSQKKLEEYQREMVSLKDPDVSSQSIAPTWVKRAAEILRSFQKNHPNQFRHNLLKKLGHGDLMIASIVDKNGDFKDLIASAPFIFERFAEGTGEISIEARGIAVVVLLDKKVLCNFAIYAQSASAGRTGGLRIATWTPHLIT